MANDQKKLLLVDDEIAILKHIKKNLQFEDFENEILLAKSCSEALLILKKTIRKYKRSNSRLLFATRQNSIYFRKRFI